MRFLDLARQALAKQDFELAATYLVKRLEEDALDFTALENLCFIWTKLGQATKAFELLNRSIGENSNVEKTYQLRGNLNLYLERYEDALADWLYLLSQSHDNEILNYQVGLLYVKLNRNELAIDYFSNVLAWAPDNETYLNDRGLAYARIGKIDRAKRDLITAHHLKPSFVGPLINLGNIEKDSGHIDEALIFYEKAVKIDPDNVTVHNNIGVAYKAKNNFQKALVSFNVAIALDQNHLLSRQNKADTLIRTGQFSTAIHEVLLLIDLNQKDEINWILLGTILKEPSVDTYSATLSKRAQELLNKEKMVRPRDLSLSLIPLIKLNPMIQPLLSNLNKIRSYDELKDCCQILIEIELLTAYMSISPIADLDLEQLFIRMRQAAIEYVDSLDFVDADVWTALSIISLQCECNQYAYPVDSYEQSMTLRLKDEIERACAVNKSDASILPKIIVYSMYEPISNFEFSNEIIEIIDVNLPVYWKRHVLNRRIEDGLKISIDSLSNINDPVSLKVKDQYEVSPYPRWITTAVFHRPIRVDQLFDELNLNKNFGIPNRVERPCILIAGCGTGQHAISTASRFLNSQVYALDLSYSSLAYGKRSAIELRQNNIEYIQGDILDLNKLNKNFDIVESLGVLHHMKDPMLGFEAVLKKLKPNGLFKIGLYSTLARREITQFRDSISWGQEFDIQELREQRLKIIQDYRKNDRLAMKLVASTDFFALSEFRDLLFHVQEATYNIDDIQELLNRLGLKFIGFEGLSPQVLYQFQSVYGPEKVHSLMHWDEFEKRYPDTFGSMYQFWTIKSS